MEELSSQKQYYIKQVASTMAIEAMPLDINAYENLTKIAVGRKTADQIINKIKKEYKNG